MKKKRRKIRRLLSVAAGLLAIALVILAIMILSPMPVVREQDARSKETELAAGLTLERIYESEPHRFVMRDDATLQGHRFVSSSPDSLVMLHGACGFDNQLNKCCGMLREVTGIDIFTYDHRGHGASPGPRGDLAYIGQYSSDVADVLKAVRALKPEGRIILGGHSMGGGIVQSYAVSDEPQLADAYLLFSPALGRGTPGSETPDFIKLHIPRILALTLLNRIGIQQLNHLPVLRFGLGEFEGHFDEYTYAATISICPTYYADGLAALDKPLLVVLGELDTKFGAVPANVAQAVKEHSRGEVVIVDDEDHHVQNSAEAIEQVSRWIAQLSVPPPEIQ